jgi:hypothetical protein
LTAGRTLEVFPEFNELVQYGEEKVVDSLLPIDEWVGWLFTH